MTSLSKTELEARRQMGRRIKEPESEITTTVSPSGTGAHCFVPKDWIGKKVRVTLLDEKVQK